MGIVIIVPRVKCFTSSPDLGNVTRPALLKNVNGRSKQRNEINDVE
jgi:hypothetical protein